MDSTDNAHNNFDSGNFDDCLSEDDNHLTTEQSSEPDNHPYEVLTTKEVMQHMHKYIKDVQSILEVNLFFVSSFSIIEIFSYPILVLIYLFSYHPQQSEFY